MFALTEQYEDGGLLYGVVIACSHPSPTLYFGIVILSWCDLINKLKPGLPISISREIRAVDSSAQDRIVQILWDPGLKGIWPWQMTSSDYKEIQPSHLEKNPPTLQHRGQTESMISHVVLNINDFWPPHRNHQLERAMETTSLKRANWAGAADQTIRETTNLIIFALKLKVVFRKAALATRQRYGNGFNGTNVVARV